MNELIVDRIEGNIVICEDSDSKIVQLSIENLEENIKEGDVLTLNNDKYTVNKELTNKRKRHIEDFTKGLWVE